MPDTSFPNVIVLGYVEEKPITKLSRFGEYINGISESYLAMEVGVNEKHQISLKDNPFPKQ